MDVINLSSSSSSDTSMSESTGPTMRMSWFLAEADEGQLRGRLATGRPTLCVLHSMELIETDITDKYLSRFVKFRINGNELEGKLILAADERSMIDGALHILNRDRAMKQNDGNHMLVQYLEEPNRLIHEIVPQKNITWPKENLQYQPLVMIGPNRFANVLHGHEDRDYMEKVMLDLKAKCFDQACDDLASFPQMNDNTWLLVQYCPNPDTIVYSVVKFSETVWHEQNMFKDVIAYLMDKSQIVIQAVVVAYSQEKADMTAKLNNLQQYFLRMDIAKPYDIDRESSPSTKIFQRSTLFQRAEERDANGERRQIRKELQEVRKNMQTEAMSLLSAFDMVDDVNTKIENRMEAFEETIPAPETSDK